jgi:hypothetical protein
MNQKKAWSQPKIQLLEARATAQADLDAMHVDPNNSSDIPSWENSESATFFGRAHQTFDS